MGHLFGEDGFFHNVMYYLPNGLDDAALGEGVTFADLVGNWVDDLVSFMIAWFIVKWIFKICIDLSRWGGR